MQGMLAEGGERVIHRDSLIVAGTLEAARTAREQNPTLEVVTFGCGIEGLESIDTIDSLVRRWPRLTKRSPNVAVIEVPPKVNEAVKQLVTATAANLETTVGRGRRWVQHLATNLSAIAYDTPAMSVPGRLKGTAAIIVGAGPSLDRNFEDIERFRGKALIIGVNSATQAVECDVQVCIEANDLRAKLSTRPAIRCYALACPPEVLAHGAGKLAPIWTGDLSRVVEGLTGIKRLSSSASGTTAAVSLAMLWGCDPIVLVGQDLAFTGGQLYAGRTGFGATVEEQGPLLRLGWSEASKALPRTVPLPEYVEPSEVTAWGGNGKVTTTPMLSAARGWLVDAGRHFRGINATEGGCHISGWTDTRLRDVPVPERGTPPAKWLRNELGVVAPPLGPRRLREWRDEQVESLDVIADLAVRVADMSRKRIVDGARLLAEGMALVPMLEPWLAEAITPIAMGRQGSLTEDVAAEVEAANDHIRLVAREVARGALELGEYLRGVKYGEG